jgi:two-component system, sensor histidine kinase
LVDLDLRMKTLYRFLVLAILLSCVAIYGNPASAYFKVPAATNGTLDLSKWNFERRGPVTIDGEWIYQPNAHLTPNEIFLESDLPLVQVPHDWSTDRLAPRQGSGVGIASYALKILIPEGAPDLTLALGSFYYASRVYVDGKLVRQAGLPGKTAQTTKSAAWTDPGFVGISGRNGQGREVEIVVHVSNFVHAQGGFRSSMVIGESDQMIRRVLIDLFTRIMFIGSAFILAIYHIILYASRPKEFAFLVFSGFLMTIAIHGVCSMSLLINIFPDASANVAIRIEYLSLILGCWSGVNFIWLVYPEVRSRYLYYPMHGYALATAIIIISTDTLFSTGLLPVIKVAVLTSLGVGILSLTVAAFKKLQGAKLFLFSMFIVAGGVGFGIVMHTLTGHSPNGIVYLSMSAMILGQASVLGGRVTNAIKTSEKLRGRLERINEDLEGQVASRTEMLEKAVDDAQNALIEAHRANRVKSQFLAMMSHEIRTPMNGIIGMADLLGQSELSDDQIDQLGVIRQSGDALLIILNDILDISKIEAGEMVLETRQFDIHDVLRRNVKLWSPRAQEKKLALESHSDLPEDLVLMGDEHRILQILSNLISNAIKFTEEGGILIQTRATNLTEDRADLEISISDTGIGIDEDKREQLFTPFSQADISTTRKYGGTGLGLSICKSLTEAMGGTITIDENREIGHGSVFTLKVSLDVDMGFLSEKPRDETSFKAPKLNILIVEDNAVSQMLATKLLEGAGHKVEVAGDGKIAMDFLNIQPPDTYDLILMDIEMPNMSGIEAVKSIRAIPALNKLPIIGVTANTEKLNQVEMEAVGFVDCVYKPIDPNILFMTIDIVTSRQSRPAKPALVKIAKSSA